MDSETAAQYSLWATVGGWLIAAFLGRKALSDRDLRMKAIEDRHIEHLKDHPRPDEVLRMHNENREYGIAVLAALARHELVHQTDFSNLNGRIDKLKEKD